MDKRLLRGKYLKIREIICLANKEKYDKEIFNQIIELPEYKESSLVLSYIPIRDEVDTLKLIEYSFKNGKKVAAPKCEGDIINFYYIESINDLKKGYYGLMEPTNNNIVTNFEKSICMVPGVTFDKKNYRIGYGKGYYDKFLKEYKGAKIGLTYKECICDKIDIEKHDIKVDKVIYS